VLRCQECVPGAVRLLGAARAAGLPVVHTLEAHRPDLSDLHPAKHRRGNLPPVSQWGGFGGAAANLHSA
jgi:nicotinamidase-related amidase